jgi:hypothetical protein
MSKFKKSLILLCMVPLTALAACGNTQTTASQCAYQIKNGYFDARHVEDILHPGERSNRENIKSKYVYCNARNYRASEKSDAQADQKTAFVAKTAKNATGDGTPVKVELAAHFSLNQNEPIMLTFLGFAEKYNAFASSDTDDNSDGPHSSSAGWNAMLQENMRFALQQSVQIALLKFPPSIWNDQDQWPKVGDAISKVLKDRLRAQTGVDEDFFCGVGVHLVGRNSTKADAWTCPEISVTIDDINPQDPSIVSVYNATVRQQNLRQLAQEEEKTNRAQLAAAKAKYGEYAEYFLGLQDTCKGGSTCVIGNASGVSLGK